MMSCTNRELVEYYLNYKLSQEDYPSPLRISGNASHRSSVGSRDRRVPPSRGTDTQALKAALRDEAHLFEERLTKESGGLYPNLILTSNNQNFKNIMDQTFEDKINWGRIVGLFVIGGAMCVQCVEDDKSELVCHIADWMTAYLDEHLNPWIQSQGGWVSMEDSLKKQLRSCYNLRFVTKNSSVSPLFRKMSNYRQMIYWILFFWQQ